MSTIGLSRYTPRAILVPLAFSFRLVFMFMLREGLAGGKTQQTQLTDGPRTSLPHPLQAASLRSRERSAPPPANSTVSESWDSTHCMLGDGWLVAERSDAPAHRRATGGWWQSAAMPQPTAAGASLRSATSHPFYRSNLKAEPGAVAYSWPRSFNHSGGIGSITSGVSRCSSYQAALDHFQSAAFLTRPRRTGFK